MDGYPVPSSTIQVEETIRRSRFVTTVARVSTRAEAKEVVQRVRARIPGATHYCWAYNAGTPGSTARIGMSDDGEPHGTAGRPMLEVLLHSGIGEVIAVCARHYGGVKLGTGGLARAYANGVKRALQACETTEKVEAVPLRVVVDYGLAEAVARVLASHDAIVVDRSFGAAVAYRVKVPIGQRSALVAALANATSGRAIVTAGSS